VNPKEEDLEKEKIREREKEKKKKKKKRENERRKGNGTRPGNFLLLPELSWRRGGILSRRR
jgi:hypothetical protein